MALLTSVEETWGESSASSSFEDFSTCRRLSWNSMCTLGACKGGSCQAGQQTLGSMWRRWRGVSAKEGKKAVTVVNRLG